MRTVRVQAARTGKGDSEVIEDAVRSALGLNLFERMWAKSDLDEHQAMDLALEAQHRDRSA